jgi:hypothetical protein
MVHLRLSHQHGGYWLHVCLANTQFGPRHLVLEHRLNPTCRWCANYVTVAMLDDTDKGFCLFAMQISSNMAEISLSFESQGIGCKSPIVQDVCCIYRRIRYLLLL